MVLPRPRIGIFAPGSGQTGPWRYTHSILAGIDPGEFDVSVFCDIHGEYTLRPWVRVVRLGGQGSGSGGDTSTSPPPAPRRLLGYQLPTAVCVWLGFVRTAHRLAGLIRQRPLDLFHTQNTGCEESPVAARLAGVPRVLGTFHVDSSYDLHRQRSGATHRILEHVSNHCLDAAIAVSRATKRDWVRRTHIPGERVVTIYNGIDPDRFRRQRSRSDARGQLGLPADVLVVGGVGRLDEAKGFSHLIAAAARLRAEFPGLVVAITGDGPMRKSLEAEAVREGVEDVVRFLGFRSDVQLVLDALDVFVLPSLCEAHPYALLEAMATKLPAVGTAVGGVPETIVDGITGFVVPPRNSDRLAVAIRTLLLDPDLRLRLGEAARDRVIREFDERITVRRTIQLYRDLLGTRRPPVGEGGL